MNNHPFLFNPAAAVTTSLLLLGSSYCFRPSSALLSTGALKFSSSRGGGVLQQRRRRQQHLSTTSTTISTMASSSSLSFIDIGANLLDDRFTKGVYRGKFRHDTDFDCVVDRAVRQGVKRIILTAGTVDESRQAVQMAREWNQLYYPNIHFSCTVGVHPTRCQQVFEPNNNNDDNNNNIESEEAKSPDELLQELYNVATDGMSDNTVVAVGEIGLDYDRLQFCSKDKQIYYLKRQLESLAEPTGLPLFLHNRNCSTDLYDILKQHYSESNLSGGVVHSFDDTIELAMSFVDELGLYIGLNGCSLKTDDNLHVAKQVPLNRILLETDCPYCEIRPTHAGFDHIQTKFDGAKSEKKFVRGNTVKNRQEPCHIVQVAEVIAGIKDVPIEEVATTCYDNTLCLYGWKKEEKK